MGRKVRILLVGDTELREKLRELTNAEARKAVQGATRESAKIIAAQVKSNAPVKSGSLRRSIKVRAIRRSRKRIGMRITTWSGDNLYQGKQFYAAFQEFGWKTGSRRNTRDAIAGRITRNLRRQSREARSTGRGLAARGSDLRKQQENYFKGEGKRLASLANVKARRQVEGSHFMLAAAKSKRAAAVALFKSVIGTHIAKVMAKRKR